MAGTKNNILSNLGSSNFKVSSGVQTTVSASDTVVTGLKKCLSVIASLETTPTATTGGKGNHVVALVAANGKDIILKTYGADAAAVTTFAAKIHWIAFGY